MKRKDFRLRRTHAVALVVTGLVIGVTMMATPAVGHVGGTVSHLWGHLKPKTDARYVNAVAGTDRAGVADKLNAITRVSGAEVNVAAGTEGFADATCPAGMFVVGGGGVGSFGSPDPYLNSSWPVSATTWRVILYNPTGVTESVTPYAVCVPANSSAGPTLSARRAGR